MFGLTNSLFGSSGIANAQQQGLTPNALSNLAGQAFNTAYSQYQQQVGPYSPQQMQNMAAGLARQKPQLWMVNGRSMDFDQFLNEVCPDPDDPHRSYLILKYKGTPSE